MSAARELTHAVRRGRPAKDHSQLVTKIAELRRDKTPWKVIEAMLGLSRTRLYVLHSELSEQKTDFCEHLSAGIPQR